MRLVYLGWEDCLVYAVAKKLLLEGNKWPGLMILVPTRESIIRLRETMVQLAPECAVRPPVMMTVEEFLMQSHDDPERDRLFMEVAWAQVIQEHDEENALIRRRPEYPGFTWSMGTAEMCLRTRAVLGECRMRIQEVVKHAALPPDEVDRWTVLADWEQQAIKRVLDWGGHDLLEEEIAWSHYPVLPSGIQRVVVAGVPDPLPLAMMALECWEQEHDSQVECWIHAPTGFPVDSWGRPCVAREEEPEWLHFNGIENLVAVCHGAQGFVEETVRYFSGDHVDSSRCSIGLCDDAFADALRDGIGRAGWSVYRSGGDKASRTGIVRLLGDIQKVVSQPDAWEPVDRVCRSGILAIALDIQSGYQMALMLDQINEMHLPSRLSFVLHLLGNRTSDIDLIRLDGDDLRKIVDWLKRWKLGHIGSMAIDLADRLWKANWNGVYQLALLKRLEVVGALVNDLEERGIVTSAQVAVELLVRYMSTEKVYMDRGSCDVVMSDWLELSYDPARKLILEGLHEGCVPDKMIEDPLLPEGMKELLGLRTRANRYQRDAFLLRGLIETRRCFDGIRILVAREDPTGEPCRPSSLLMQCEAEQLPHRVLYLFHEAREDKNGMARNEKGWAWRCPQPVRMPESYDLSESGKVKVQLSPSRLKDFLTCPRRFWLKQVCRFQRLSLGNEIDPMSIGTLIHLCAERLGPKGDLGQVRDEKTIAQELADGMQKEFERLYGRHLSLPLMVQREFVRQRLEDLAQVHVRSLEMGWHLLEVERTLLWEPWDLPVVLKMKLDRIEVNEETKVLRVVDIKTSATASLPEQHHLEKLSAKKVDLLRTHLPQLGDHLVEEKKNTGYYRWKDLQLPLYVLAAQRWIAAEYNTQKVTCAYLNLPLHGGNRGIQAWESLDSYLLEIADYWAQEVSRLIVECDLSRLPAAEDLGWNVYKNDEFASIAPEGVNRLLAQDIEN